MGQKSHRETSRKVTGDPMAETIRAILQIMGALGGVASFFFLIVWNQRQTIEEKDHAAIRTQILALVQVQSEFKKDFAAMVTLQQEQAARILAAEQNNSYLKETVHELKSTISDLRDIVNDLATSVAVLASKVK